MANKPIKAVAKITLPAGAANPAPPVGTALGPHGINLMDFCKQFNAATKDMVGDTIPVVITIYEDRSFSLILKTPPASALLKKAAGIEKGSGNALTTKVGKVTKEDIKKIVEKKRADLNAGSDEAAMRIIEGTARNMGIEVEK